MNITDEMVERAAKASWAYLDEHAWGTVWDELPDDGDVKLIERDKARAALTAALGDVEPLEDVLGAKWRVVSLLSNRIVTGEVLWFATIKSRTTPIWIDSASGPTIDAAIRAAVANAKGAGQ